MASEIHECLTAVQPHVDVPRILIGPSDSLTEPVVQELDETPKEGVEEGGEVAGRAQRPRDVVVRGQERRASARLSYSHAIDTTDDCERRRRVYTRRRCEIMARGEGGRPRARANKKNKEQINYEIAAPSSFLAAAKSVLRTSNFANMSHTFANVNSL